MWARKNRWNEACRHQKVIILNLIPYGNIWSCFNYLEGWCLKQINSNSCPMVSQQLFSWMLDSQILTFPLGRGFSVSLFGHNWILGTRTVFSELSLLHRGSECRSKDISSSADVCDVNVWGFMLQLHLFIHLEQRAWQRNSSTEHFWSLLSLAESSYKQAGTAFFFFLFWH